MQETSQNTLARA